MNDGRTCYVKWNKKKNKITNYWIYSFSIRKYKSHVNSSPTLAIAKNEEEAAKFYMNAVRFDYDTVPKYWEIVRGHDGFEIKITVKRTLTKYSVEPSIKEAQDKREVEEVVTVYIDKHELREGILRIPSWLWRY